MFFKKKPEPKISQSVTIQQESIPVEFHPQLATIQKQLEAMQGTKYDEIIREMFKMMNMIADCKNYAYIQTQRDLIQNLLDKLPKV